MIPLDPELEAYNAAVAAAVPRATDATPHARRTRAELIASRFAFPADAVARTDHWLALPGREVAVRVYRPRAGRLPALLYLHGGGWVSGSIATHDGICATLARDAGVVVASVNYRRVPENPWPAPNDDAYAALVWLAANAAALDVDARRIGVGGDSAGAHLAIGVALEARDRPGPPLALQLLIYPVIEPGFTTASYARHAVTATLTRDDMMEFWRLYLPQPGAGDARALPGQATLAGLPPAHVVVAGHDPLHDEGASFASRLASAGVTVTLAEAPALAHGFVRAVPFVAAARAAVDAMSRAVAAALSR
ncbi:MAG TPA: alpha/beta hydrolase [Casimicrobiaceae bacterium]|nr:alpha/beta hydrolase [Casimicrobiaceae bacterium]